MFTDQIEKLKTNFTDKYVVVDASRPELARFRDHVGVVRTVNMSGRALVEFANYHHNIGWYDIDLAFLKVVDKPVETAAEPAAAKKTEAKAAPAKKPAPAGEKKLSPLELARSQGAGGKAEKPATPTPKQGGKSSTADILASARGGAKPAAPAGKQSTADILAAARGGKAAPAADASAAKPASAKPSTADILAAARGKASAASAPQPAAPPAAQGKPSTADILAAARGGKPATGQSPPAEPAAASPAEPPASQAEAAAAKVSNEPAKVDKKSMSVADMLAYCRAHDAS